MITRKAAQKLLDGIATWEQDYCFCVDPDCESGLDHGVQPPTHAITFITPSGALDTAENAEYLGGPGWGYCGDLDDVLDYPQNFPEVADQMVVIERATGRWQLASAYLS